MDLFEIADKSGVSLRNLRKLNKLGVLICEGSSSPVAAEMRYYLGRSQPLTVKHIVALIESPSLLLELGPKQAEARAQLDALRNGEGADIMPAGPEVVAELAGAASGDADALAHLIEWAKTMIPAGRSVPHHYLAARLLLGVPENLRKYEAPRLGRVFLHMRKSDAFAGWWHVEFTGARKATLYHRPRASFDL